MIQYIDSITRTGEDIKYMDFDYVYEEKAEDRHCILCKNINKELR